MKDYASITYTDSRGNVFDLMAQDVHWINSAEGFHSYEWEPEATETRFGERLRAWKKSKKELSITLVVSGTEDERANYLNDLHDAFEYDITVFSPGTITWEDYSIKCYCTSSKTAPVSSSEIAMATANELTFYCPNPFWSKMLEYKEYIPIVAQHIEAYVVGGTPYTASWLSTVIGGEPLSPQENTVYDVKTPGEFFDKSFIWVATSSLYVEISASDYAKTYDEDGFNYAYDYMYSYEPERAGVINNSNALGSKYIMTIYGPVYGDEATGEGGPFVVIRNSITQTGVTVSFPGQSIPVGGKLVVNSIDKTTIMTTAEWDEEDQDYIKVNVFGKRNLDYYLWDTVPTGKNSVIIDGDYKVQLQLYEERSEPKWRTG